MLQKQRRCAPSHQVVHLTTFYYLISIFIHLEYVLGIRYTNMADFPFGYISSPVVFIFIYINRPPDKSHDIFRPNIKLYTL